MIDASYILAAASDDDTGTIVKVVVVVVVLGLALLKRVVQKKEDRQAEEAPPVEQEPVEEVRPVPKPPPVRHIPPPLPSRLARPVVLAEEHVRTVRDETDLDTVDEEADRMRAALERKIAERQHRLESAAPTEADTAAIDARLTHFRRMEVQPEQVARIQVELRTIKTLRAAVVFSEIIGPPKALRLPGQGSELWDQ